MKLRPAAALLLISAIVTLPARALADDHHGKPRLFVLMVWDGLRPDAVTQRDTPNLFALAHDGVRFDRHHAQFPTITMVNAAALATGANPGINGIFGDDQDFAPALRAAGVSFQNDSLTLFEDKSAMLEDSKLLAVANAPDGFNGRLMAIDTVEQEVEREGGYVAVIGKTGPTYLFDDRVATVAGGADLLHQPHADYLFLADDYASPSDKADPLLAALPPASKTGVSDHERDSYFAKIVAEQAIPAAKRALDGERPALIVLWQHNPDITQHHAGLGTVEAITALSACDQNLGTVRAGLAANGLQDRSDVMVVSDHGFATIRLRVNLSAMLAAAELKKSEDSTDVIVAPNGGADLIYLSPTAFKTREERALRLQKIVNFCEAQEWCGAIFSREPAPVAPGVHAGRAPHLYLGWIDGTFAASALGLLNVAQTPDLVISFREIADLDNSTLTGPTKPAFSIGVKGQQIVPNHSSDLLHPIRGVVYADTGPRDTFTTGMGMHGAAGTREIHNFCAAAGPDFRHHYVDQYPTANTDVAPTITDVLGLLPNTGPGGVIATGRALSEAYEGGRASVGAPHTMTMTTDLKLAGVEAITTLRVTKLGDRLYLDDSTIDHKPLGSSP